MIRIINQALLLAMLAVALIGAVAIPDTLAQTRLSSSTVVIESTVSRSALYYHNTNPMWKAKPAIGYHTSDR